VSGRSWLEGRELRLSVGSCETVASRQRREHGRRRIHIVGIRYQATASESMEDLACAVVRSARISDSVIITCNYDL
jgi:hypothetical protein